MRENPNKWFGIQELARMFKTTENNMSLKLTLLQDKLVKIDLGRTGRPLRGARVLYRVNKRYR